MRNFVRKIIKFKIRHKRIYMNILYCGLTIVAAILGATIGTLYLGVLLIWINSKKR